MNSLQPLIIESAELMIIGMGTVFIILIMLIFLINLVSKALARLNLLDDAPPPSRKTSATRKKTTASNDTELIAVISSAIATYKKRQPN
ncbi:MAG: OadG family protein [Gammaproteobacteria bacterium]|nr:OadG family protein [Gammaproteobacteria bacterium]